MDMSLVLVVGVIVFFIFSGIRFRKVKLLSKLVYEQGEEKIAEDQPLSIEEKSVGNGKKRTTRIGLPYLILTNKRMIIVQKKETSPDGYIRNIFSFDPVSEPVLSAWWKHGYATIQVDKETVHAVASSESGAYTIVFRLMVQLPIGNMGGIEQTVEITTTQFSVYEKAVGRKIQVQQEK